MRRGALTLCAVILTGGLASAGPAGAVIQVQEGISGVRLGMTQDRVRESLGTPRVRTGTNEFGPFTEFRYGGGIVVMFQGNTNVTAVSISGPTDRTKRGVGVGSSERKVRRRVPGVRCETIARIRSCHVGDFRPGQRVTDFLIRRGRVVRVTVGLVID